MPKIRLSDQMAYVPGQRHLSTFARIASWNVIGFDCVGTLAARLLQMPLRLRPLRRRARD